MQRSPAGHCLRRQRRNSWRDKAEDGILVRHPVERRLRSPEGLGQSLECLAPELAPSLFSAGRLGERDCQGNRDQLVPVRHDSLAKVAEDIREESQVAFLLGDGRAFHDLRGSLIECGHPRHVKLLCALEWLRHQVAQRLELFRRAVRQSIEHRHPACMHASACCPTSSGRSHLSVEEVNGDGDESLSVICLDRALCWRQAERQKLFALLRLVEQIGQALLVAEQCLVFPSKNCLQGQLLHLDFLGRAQRQEERLDVLIASHGFRVLEIGKDFQEAEKALLLLLGGHVAVESRGQLRAARDVHMGRCKSTPSRIEMCHEGCIVLLDDRCHLCQSLQKLVVVIQAVEAVIKIVVRGAVIRASAARAVHLREDASDDLLALVELRVEPVFNASNRFVGVDWNDDLDGDAHGNSCRGM